MDNAEYELSAQKACNLANEANEMLSEVKDPHKVNLWMNFFGANLLLIKFDPATNRFVPRDPDYNLDPETMRFTPADVGKRGKENVEKLKEISGK